MDTGETTTETNSEVKTEQIDDKKKASEEVSDGSKGHRVSLYFGGYCGLRCEFCGMVLH